MIFSMSYNIQLTDSFKKEAKKLAKKYPSLKSDLARLGKILIENPTYGKHLGNNIFKIRLSITSKGRGKSGGARILTYFKLVKQTVYLFTIYDKSEKSTISDQEIKKLLLEISNNPEIDKL